jgi:endonuclease YncB( thermonuclease family)
MMLTKRVICLMLLLTSGSAYSGDLAGQASIIDGDTLEIHGTRIRVWGIDAPESSLLCRGNDSLQYRCGARAANELAAMVGGRPVICQPLNLDRYDRTVASCSVGGTDVAEWLVRQGWALDWPQYSHRHYASAENDAHLNERGIWAGSYVEPWRFRECMKLGGQPAACSDEAR